MSAITPSFIHRVDHNIQVLTENAYLRLSQKTWWDKVAKLRPSGSKVEQLIWMLTTAKIERTGSEGEVPFEDIVELTFSAENEFAAAGLKLLKSELTDADGNGLNRAAKWAADIGEYMAYFPQAMIAEAILGGESTTTAYDGENFFSTSHPLNPYRTGAGTYANLMTSTASGSYPGALPIGGNLDTAFDNLAKGRAYVQGIKTANGSTPRNLDVVAMLVPPALFSRAQILTQGRFMPLGGVSATADAAPAGFADIAVYSAPELGAGYTNGSDSAYYLVTSGVGDTDMSAFVYQERESFSMTNHDEFTDAEIRRSQEFEWIVRGRNTVVAGHPYGLIKCKAT